MFRARPDSASVFSASAGRFISLEDVRARVLEGHVQIG